MEKPNKTELATLLKIEAAACAAWESALDNQRFAQAAYYSGHGTKEAWEAATKAESEAHASWEASWQASKKAELAAA